MFAEPLTDVQKDLLQSVWGLALLTSQNGDRVWPTWDEVEGDLYRRQPELEDATPVFNELPGLPRPTVGSERYSLLWANEKILQKNTQVGLTIAGLRRLGELGDNPEYADAMARILGHLARLANAPNPPDEVSLSDVGSELLQRSRSIPMPFSQRMIVSTLECEYAVPVSCYDMNGSWRCHLELDRQRRYRKVTNAADYFDVLAKMPEFKDPRQQVAQGATVTSQGIFLVHGRDDAARNEVDLFVRDATGLTPTVLANEASAGLTVIEKFEKHAAEAAYAIVLMTADDAGSLVGDDAQARARQNVIFELGYFFGKLGRGRVAVLTVPGVEHPSDTAGLIYIPYGSDNSWREELRKELKNAKLPMR